MRLIISFSTETGDPNPRAVDLPARLIGREQVRLVRRECDPELTLEDFNPDVSGHTAMGLWIEISEKDLARLPTEYFVGGSSVEVSVPHAKLNQFFNLGYEVGYRSDTGFKINFYYKLDKSALFDAWVADGAPLKWKNMHDELREAATPLLDFLKKYYHPHAYVVVEMGKVEVVEGSMSVPVKVPD